MKSFNQLQIIFYQEQAHQLILKFHV